MNLPTRLFFITERVIRKLISHYASHPAIIGYQVDNDEQRQPITPTYFRNSSGISKKIRNRQSPKRSLGADLLVALITSGTNCGSPTAIQRRI